MRLIKSHNLYTFFNFFTIAAQLEKVKIKINLVKIEFNTFNLNIL